MEQDAVGLTIEDLSPVKKKLSFEIPWEEVKRELDSAYTLVGRKAKIKGFRSGKAPRKLLEMYHKEEAENEALSNLISKRYGDAVREHDIPVVSQPDIDQKGIEENKNFSFTATVEIQPKVEPTDYIGISVTKEEIEVTDEDVSRRLDEMREIYATLESVQEPRETVAGDYIVIDFEVTVDGEARKELSTENYGIEIGSGRFIPGFEEQLTGLKRGDEKTVEMTFPDDYRPEELAGKQGFFRVTVKDIKEKKIPPLDDEFVKNFDTFETVEGLREAVRESMVGEAAKETEAKLRKSIIDALLEKNEFQVPLTWVEQQTYQLMVDLQRRMMSSGMSREKSAEAVWRMRENLLPHAERMVKSGLLISRIAENESIVVGDDELEKRIEEMTTGDGRTYDQLREIFQSEEARNRLIEEMLEDKAMAFLIEKAQIKVEKKSYADLKREAP